MTATFFMRKFFVITLSLLAVLSCSKGNKMADVSGLPMAMEGAVKDGSDMSYAEPPMDGSGGQGVQVGAGIVTAGEWCDLDHWDFWSKLPGGLFKPYVEDWGFYTDQRIAVRVVGADGLPACGVRVEVFRDDVSVWTSRTDNHGRAECWPALYAPQVPAGALSIAIAGQLQEEAPKVTWLQDGTVQVNTYAVSSYTEPSFAADIAFIVDATGSMSDELEFLKSDLSDIIGKVMQSQSGMKIRTGAVFYRDEGDEYVTLSSQFNEELSVTRDFISRQSADGGGDFPEAVHTALEASLQELSWSNTARSRIAFMLLDAPAHKSDEIRKSLQNSISAYARAGIKLIPVSASGIDKETEAMLRFFAIGTNATYTFITNDSGVGNDHIEATVGEYQVEKLNELIIRLINYYTETVSAEAE